VTWAIFYNGPLEFTQCATMIVNGRVHANGRIYVGTSASLTFSNGVSTTSILDATPMDGVSSYGTNWHTYFTATPGYTTNVASVTVSLAMTNAHFMIDVPPATELATSILGLQRLYNKAQMVLLVTNTYNTTNLTVSLKVQTSINGAVPGYDPTPSVLLYTNATVASLATNLPFLSLTNSTYDQRERKTNLLTQIDIGKFSGWITTNSTVQSKLPSSSQQYPTILYVADRRSVSTGQLAAVRVMNGAQLPYNNGMGFSVATQNPLYVWGNYNIQTNSSGGISLNTNTTTFTAPAALMSDSLTVLSPVWTDDQGFQTYSQSTGTHDATNMTINAAIVAGTIPSTTNTDTTFSGGVHNLPRLLEDWSSSHLWLNTSVLRLWDSQWATTQFRNPAGFNPTPVNPYYNPPTRHYSFDLNYLDPAKVPPGIPVALVPIRFGWGVPPPDTTTYTPVHN
ncbi:MAG: hypothetical protein RL616_105, partial [Verrucomicrobiota bacterium]